jgi:uncharacterized protein YyaL (SSP411 family)
MVLSELTASAAALAAQQKGSTGVPAQSTPLKNRAGESKNPFVQSYRDSPVAWQPLNEEAIERAKADGKLLFLHIGYKACHCRFSCHFLHTGCLGSN